MSTKTVWWVLAAILITASGFGVGSFLAQKPDDILPGTVSSSSNSVNNELPSSTKPRPLTDLIRVDDPRPNDFIKSPLTIKGTARGTWYFEASFPIELRDENDKKIASGIGQAQGEWMTENFVPFKATLSYTGAHIGKATLILHRDNPSGLPQNDAEIRIPLNFEPPSAAGGDGEKMPSCVVTGCSSELCVDKEMASICTYRPEYACYKGEKCERQTDGQCGWTKTPELETCLERMSQSI